MLEVRSGPVIGLLGQGLVLAALTVSVGLGTPGWSVGLGYGVITFVALTLGLHRRGAPALGPADWVTMTRATLVGGVAALAAESVSRPVSVVLMVTLAVVALLLDAVDGKVARRTGTASALGARFDMEVDAFLILALSGYLAMSVGGWVLAIGAMRYAYVVASWAMPWLRGRLPARHWRKVVAAVQGTVLVVAVAEVLPQPLVIAVLAAALALLTESFGRDVVWLTARRPTPPRADVVTGRRSPAVVPGVAILRS